MSFEGKPATISETTISSLKKVLAGDVEVLNECYHVGMKVRICRGQFLGVEGVLISKNGKSRLLIQIEALNMQVSVEVSAAEIMPL